MLIDQPRGIDRVAEQAADHELLHGGNRTGDIAIDDRKGDAIARVNEGALIRKKEKIENHQLLRGANGPTPETGLPPRAKVADEASDEPAQLVVGDAGLKKFGVEKHCATVE